MATNEPEIIEQLWTKFSQANIGVPMGIINGLFAIDFDGSEGKETMMQWLSEFGELPATWQLQTGGGFQLWYRIPDGISIPNSVKKIGKNVDLRGEGGQSVGAGSLHYTGRYYKWVAGRSPANLPLADAPQWLINKIIKVAQEQKQAKKIDGLVIDPEPPKEKIKQLMQRSKVFKDIIRGVKVYESPSQRDQALANIMAVMGCENNEIASTLYHLRMANGDGEKHDQYYNLTVSKAKQWAEEEQSKERQEQERQAEKLREMFSSNGPAEQEENIPAAGGGDNYLFKKKHVINITDSSIHDLSDQAWDALKEKNDENPTIFVRNWKMVEIRTDEEGRAQFVDVDEASLRGKIDRCAEWMKWKQQGKETKEVLTQPPRFVVQDMLAEPNMPLPKRQGITHAPVFSPDGSLEMEEGYLKSSKLYYSPNAGGQVKEVAKEPTDTEVRNAVDLLINDLLIDFPFKDQASRTHALSMIFLPFVRQMIKGPTPLHLIDAPKRGAGKSLLARTTHLIATGMDASMSQLPRNEEETEKQLVSLLADGRPMIVLDNVNGRVERNSLNSVLTSTRYSGRILGQSKMIELPNLATWIMTGNNVDLDGDIHRRVAWIRLQSREQQDDYQHPDLLDWVEENRAEIIHAILTIIQNWIAKGRKKGTNLLPTFEAWSRVMGGIFTTAGVDGFLDNKEELEEHSDTEGGLWEQFCEIWWDKYQDNDLAAVELWALAEEKGMLLEVLGDGNERSRKIRLGKELKKQQDRIYSGYRIHTKRDTYRKRNVYWLVKL